VILPKPRTMFQTAATVTAGGALALSLIFVLSPIMPALLWAGVLAIALWPSYSKVYKWRNSRAWRNIIAPLMFTIVVGLAIAAPVALAAVEIGHEGRALMTWIDNARQGGTPLPPGLSTLPWIGTRIASWWKTNLVDPRDATILFREVGPSQLLGLTRSVGVEIFHRVLLFVVTIMTLFFLFRDGQTLATSLLRIGKAVFGEKSASISHHVVEAIHGTVDGLVLVGLAEGAVIGVGYFITGLPHAAVFTIVTGVLAIIPFGAPLTFCFASVILLSTGKAVSAAAVVAFGFFVVFVTDHFIRPFLIGGASRIPFLLVLLGLLGGVTSLGIVGLFVGPALMAVLMAVWRDLGESKGA
jgi:predicted PurR-regulated permease PerM